MIPFDVSMSKIRVPLALDRVSFRARTNDAAPSAVLVAAEDKRE
jgi:hypothetical protein